jgi:predicted nicotinamide N-methyase
MSADRTNLLRRRLLARIHRRYHTVTETRRVGDMEILFTRIADPNRVLDEVAAEEDRDGDELHLPYWAELWDSAFGIAQYIHRHHGTAPYVDGSNTLDLGCGMGYSGAVAAALGHRVMFADLEPASLLFARLNSAPWAHRVRTRRLNWRTDRLDEQFDVILGADILYERKQWEHQEPFFRHHLRANGAILLGEPGRQTGDNFQPWIRERGWTLTVHEEPVPTRSRPIRLIQLTHSSPI